VSPPRESLPVGVVVERRRIDNPWQEFAWKPVEVIPGAPACEEWRVLRRGEGWVHYLAATLPIELHKRATLPYRINLASEPPLVYVVLRPAAEPGREFRPFLVTVDPTEAEALMTGGEAIVEGVPMPEGMAAWVQAFVDAHHVEEPFRKLPRKRTALERPAYGRNGAQGRPQSGAAEPGPAPAGRRED
jgi:hypothetical protein